MTSSRKLFRDDSVDHLPTKEQLLAAARKIAEEGGQDFDQALSNIKGGSISVEVKLKHPEYRCRKIWSKKSYDLEQKLRSRLKVDGGIPELSSTTCLSGYADGKGVGLVETIATSELSKKHRNRHAATTADHHHELVRLFSNWKYFLKEYSTSKVAFFFLISSA
jgi:hypothetical protein